VSLTRRSGERPTPALTCRNPRTATLARLSQSVPRPISGWPRRFCVGRVLLFVVAVLSSSIASAQETAEEFESKLGYRTGVVDVGDGLATLRLPDSFRFIGPEGSKRLLVDAWGNPAETAEDVLGMLVPSAVSPLADEGWGIVITFDSDGYVDDEDAGSIDYGKMLREMQESAAEANEERTAQGFDAVRLIGWAEPPHYDAAAHKLYWAKELAFGDSPEHTLNYNIRILGRRGVLVLNAVSQMGQLEEIRSSSQALLPAVEFNDGHRYADYLPGTDKAATYGLAGLIAGGAAAKGGLFKALWLGLLASKKVVAGLVVAAAAFARKVFSQKTAEA
jgi:uncharacterized membrane-anchored protein